MSLLHDAWRYLSRVLGLETVDRFPPGHAYPLTRWNRAYFDIASDLKAGQIEDAICAAIANTPSVFAHIKHPTPRMQRALLSLIEARVRRSVNDAADLVALLILAYDSPHTPEILPGLRDAIRLSRHEAMPQRVVNTLAFLGQMQSPFDVIEAGN